MMPRIFFGCMPLLAGLLIAKGAIAADIEKQRQSYVAAIAAARSHDDAAFQENFRQLDGYVLRGYAQYEYLKDRVEQTPEPVIRKFLSENGRTPLPDLLRQRWLHVFAARQDWPSFMREYVDMPGDTELTCFYLAQRLKAGDSSAALMQRIEQLWSTGHRQPAACNPLFAAWSQAGRMTTDKVWERVAAAMEAREPSLAKDLADYLAPADRVWIDRWLAVYRDPAGALDNIGYPIDTPVARMIVRQGVVRLAYRDAAEAMRRWEQLKKRYQFSGDDDDYVLRNVGILAAQNRLPQALKWLAAVKAQPDDISLKLWRVYAALWAGEWETARRFIAALPEEEQNSTRWRYWTARIMQHGGDEAGAKRIYAGLARERDYYGFLAADRIGAEYSMQHVAVDASEQEIAKLEPRPELQAAKELFTLDQIVDARRQWQWALRDLNSRELQAAAVIARRWGWYDRAIQAVVMSGHPDDLELRFPVIYRDVIEANAAEYKIDPSWIYGVVRQESAFVVDARSDAGAIGLMQLLPSTGRAGVRRLKLGTRVEDALLTVEHNVRIGVNYLKQVLERYGGHQVLATAAYNAGPNRVNSWIPPQPTDADVWIETIPYNETRGYVKNVLAFATVYEYRLGKPAIRMTTRMPAIAPRNGNGAS